MESGVFGASKTVSLATLSLSAVGCARDEAVSAAMRIIGDSGDLGVVAINDCAATAANEARLPGDWVRTLFELLSKVVFTSASFGECDLRAEITVIDASSCLVSPDGRTGVVVEGICDKMLLSLSSGTVLATNEVSDIASGDLCD